MTLREQNMTIQVLHLEILYLRNREEFLQQIT